jgi:hypothetical protein
MSQSFDSGSRRDSVTVPKIWVAVALSLLVHGLALWQWPRDVLRPSADELPQERNARGPMIVQIVPERRAAPPAPRVQPAPRERPAVAQPAKPRRASPPPPPPRAQPRPPVLALPRADAPAPPAAAPAPPRPPAPTPRRDPTSADLMAYVDSQRRARIDLTGRSEPAEAPPAPPAREDENARANRIAAANMGTGNKPAMGADPRRGGGIFEIKHIGYDYAEFAFFGWNKEMRRNTAQIIEVRKGSNSDIRIAVVRRMIDIIRDHEQADFTWQSQRLGRVVTMSARQRDTAGLEAFLMREFFDEGRPASRR